jgi:hypothetical protein
LNLSFLLCVSLLLSFFIFPVIYLFFALSILLCNFSCLSFFIRFYRLMSLFGSTSLPPLLVIFFTIFPFCPVYFTRVSTQGLGPPCRSTGCHVCQMTIHISFLIFRAYRFLFITQPIGWNTGRLPHTRNTANSIFGCHRKEVEGRRYESHLYLTGLPCWRLGEPQVSVLTTVLVFHVVKHRKVKARCKHRHL